MKLTWKRIDRHVFATVKGKKKKTSPQRFEDSLHIDLPFRGHLNIDFPFHFKTQRSNFSFLGTKIRVIVSRMRVKDLRVTTWCKHYLPYLVTNIQRITRVRTQISYRFATEHKRKTKPEFHLGRFLRPRIFSPQWKKLLTDIGPTRSNFSENNNISFKGGQKRERASKCIYLWFFPLTLP